MKKLFIVTILILNVLSGLAQDSYMKIADKYSSESVGTGRNMSMSVKWIDNEGRYAYYTAEENDERVYYLMDIHRKKVTCLFDNSVMAEMLVPYSDNGRIPQADNLGIGRIDFMNQSPDLFQCEYNGRLLEYDVRKRRLREIPMPAKRIADEIFWDRDYTSDSLYYVTVDRHNLILADKNGNRTVLTSDSIPYYTFSSDDPYSEGTGGATGCWIGKTHKFLAVREDMRDVEDMSIIDSRKGRPVAKNYKYAAAGDRGVLRHELFLVDADKREAVQLNVGRYPDQKIDIPLLKPFDTTDECAFFIRRSRTCDSLELCCVDTGTDSVRAVIKESAEPHLNEQLFGYHIIDSGNEILWWSERSGLGQYYLYDKDGNLKNQITDGRFVAGKISYIDTERRHVIVEGYGGEKDVNPHYRLFYKVPLDGGESVCLTPEDGHHSINIAPGGKFLYDRWSRMDLPEQRRICDLEGNTVMTLPGADISDVCSKGWKKPELLELMAADSVTKLYGVVYLPFDIDPEKKYPVISNVYPGPHDDLVPLAFSFDSNENVMLAQLGFIVIQFSHRGSCPTRGKEYYNYGYGNLRDYALADDIAIIRQIAEKYPFADLSRVGIYGHSGGGFMTAAAMLEYPDFYKVGVAASGNHDNNIYYQSWGETYHGVKQVRDSEGRIHFECSIPTTVELAPNLKGKLLLVHGEMDSNVHPASTLRLADAFIRAGKRFDMMIIPGADHNLPVRYYNNLVRYYFVENLLGLPQDDVDIVKHE